MNSNTCRMPSHLILSISTPYVNDLIPWKKPPEIIRKKYDAIKINIANLNCSTSLTGYNLILYVLMRELTKMYLGTIWIDEWILKFSVQELPEIKLTLKKNAQEKEVQTPACCIPCSGHFTFYFLFRVVFYVKTNADKIYKTTRNHASKRRTWLNPFTYFINKWKRNSRNK